MLRARQVGPSALSMCVAAAALGYIACGSPPRPSDPSPAASAASSTSSSSAARAPASSSSPGSGSVAIGAALGSDLAIGALHVCELSATGAVACFGENSFGQLGDGTVEARTGRVVVGGLPPIAQIAARGAGTCALSKTGEVFCWGSNNNDQITGDGSRAMQLKPAKVAVAPASRVAMLDSQTCALTTAGEVWCWGSLGPSWGPSTPTRMAGVAPATDLIAGSHHACAIVANGRMMCWGSGSYGELGDGKRVSTTDPATGQPQVVPVSDLTNVVSAAAGMMFSCAATADGSAYCWGRNEQGQVGDGTKERRVVPVRVRGLTDVVAITTGSDHACARVRSGAVYCWGSNAASELGSSAPSPAVAPVQVTKLARATSLVAGNARTCARPERADRATDPAAVCWGTGNAVLATLNPAHAAVARLAGVTSATSIAVDGVMACTLAGGGAVSCWRTQYQSQLLPNGATPFHRATIPGAVSLAGGHETCALLSSGGVSCFATSRNPFSSCHRASEPMRADPVRKLSNAVEVAVGSHSCAATRDGKLSCWIEGGDEMPANACDAGLAPGFEQVAHVGAGHAYLCAARTDGTVVCSHGKEGGVPTGPPSPIAGITDAVALAGGKLHMCARRRSGEVSCWGDGQSGQLGDGTWKTRDSAAPVSGLTDVIDLAAGGAHTCAVRKGGQVLCWGGNFDGQLHDGTMWTRLRPTPVRDVADVTHIAASGSRTCVTHRTGGPTCWGGIVNP